MRIVGGNLRGRALTAPSGPGIRPTSDRLRETIFNVAENLISFSGLRVIDLFAGTGALGIEALSRGAGFALFVENSTQGRALIRANLETLGIAGKARLYRRDAARLGNAGTLPPFDLAFADPPYGKRLAEPCVDWLIRGNWLKQDAWLILEEAARDLPDRLPGFSLVTSRRQGDSAFGVFRRVAAADNGDHDQTVT